MSSTKDYLYYVLEQLRDLNNISYKPMMGEYLIYVDGVLIGGLYDDRLLVKKVEGNHKYNMEDNIPYDGAKPMYLVSEIDNKSLLEEIILSTYNSLKK